MATYQPKLIAEEHTHDNNAFLHRQGKTGNEQCQ